MLDIHNYNELNGNNININIKEIDIRNIINNINNLPYSIKKLRLYCNKFNNFIDNLPNNIISLFLCCNKFNNNLNNLSTELYLLNICSVFFNKQINKLPNGLNEICIQNSRFNHHINNLPINLKDLYLHSCMYNKFNNNINNLPILVKYLSLNYENFNYNIDNLPNYMFNLQIYCNSFNQKLNNLPLSLISLKLFSNQFKQKNVKLPLLQKFYTNVKIYSSINIIKNLLYDHNDDINNIIPYNVKELKIKYYKFIINILSSSLKLLDIYHKSDIFDCVDNLPCSLFNLSLKNYMYNNKLNNLPISLIKLKLGNLLFSSKLIKLPLLQCLSIHNQIEYIPTTIKILELYNSKTFNFDFLPEGIEKLKIYNCDKQINDLPSSIKEIWINKKDIGYINKIYHHKVQFLSY